MYLALSIRTVLSVSGITHFLGLACLYEVFSIRFEKDTYLHEAPVEHPFRSSLSSETTVPMAAYADVFSFTLYSVEIEFCPNYRQSGTSSTLFLTHCAPIVPCSSGLTCTISVFAKCQECLPCHFPCLATMLTLIICIERCLKRQECIFPLMTARTHEPKERRSYIFGFFFSY